MKVHALIVGGFFVAGAAIGVSTVHAASKSFADQPVTATQEDEAEPNCYQLLTKPNCVTGIVYNCVCSISGTSGEADAEGDGSVSAPQVPSYLSLQY